MISLCLTENALKRPSKAMSPVAIHIYIRRPLLKAIFQLQCIDYVMLVHANHLTKYHPYHRGRKNNRIFMCSTTLFQGPLQHTSHSIFMAYYRSIPLEVSMAKPFLGSAVQEMKPNRSNFIRHLTFPPTKSHSKLGRFAEGNTNRYFYDVRQSEMSHWTVLWWLGTYCHCSC